MGENGITQHSSAKLNGRYRLGYARMAGVNVRFAQFFCAVASLHIAIFATLPSPFATPYQPAKFGCLFWIFDYEIELVIENRNSYAHRKIKIP
jgi:hypothetical protein